MNDYAIKDKQIVSGIGLDEFDDLLKNEFPDNPKKLDLIINADNDFNEWDNVENLKAPEFHVK